MEQPEGMIEGAFAFLDCLGFKGIWGRDGPKINARQLINFLHQAEARVKATPIFQATATNATNIEIIPIFISDTVAVSVSNKHPLGFSDPELTKGHLVSVAALMSVELCKIFATAPGVPLLLRGVVTFGSYLAEGRFLIGPAVDEAATLAEVAQGSFIWLTPVRNAFIVSFSTSASTRRLRSLCSLHRRLHLNAQNLCSLSGKARCRNLLSRRKCSKREMVEGTDRRAATRGGGEGDA